LLVAIGAVCGCKHAPVADPLVDAFGARGVAKARQLAPDLFVRAEQARREAASAHDEDARADARSRARLWLKAASVEAERIEAERAAAAFEVRVAVADARRLQALAQLAALAGARSIEAAAEAARVRASRMLAGGALQESLQHGDVAALADATEFVRDRASLLLAAARALGLDTARARGLDARLLAMSQRATVTPSTAVERSAARSRLRAMLDALPLFERALGEARLSHPGPTREERSALQSAAAERGLTLTVLDGAALLVLAEPSFVPGGANLSERGAQALDHMSAMLRLHPRGAVEIRHGASQLSGRRAAAIAVRLRSGRVRPLVVAAGPPGDPPELAVALPAYGLAAPQP
jgi:hypothetical protein